MKKYEIAGIKIAFNYLFDEFFKDNIEKYEISDDSVVNYEIQTILVDFIDEPKGTPSIVNKHRYVYQENNQEVIIYKNDEGKIIEKITSDNNLSKILIEIIDTKIRNLKEYEYHITGLLFLLIATKEKRISIHASAISYQNEAVIFSAPSTTGKSTHASMWKRLFAGVDYINDDKPLLFFKDNICYVSGSPWSGKNIINNNVTLKVRSIVFLRQAKNEQINELSDNEKLTLLLKNVYRPIKEEAYEIVLDTIQELIAKVDMYLLDATLNDNSAYLIHNKLFNQ